MNKLRFDKDRLAQAKEIRERWYLGEPVDRTPYVYMAEAAARGSWMQANPYNFKEMCNDSKTAAEGQLLSIQHQFDSFPDSDYLPVMNLFYLGEGILASIYGAEQYIVEHDPPYTKGRLFSDIYEAQKLSNDFEVEDTTWGRVLKEHVERFVDITDGQVPVGPPDYQSPYGTATKLMPNEELMMAIYDEPELVHTFLGRVTDGIIKLSEAMLKWVGPELYAHNHSNPIPGKCGFMIWDDYISVLNPDLHKEFCMPQNLRLFERFGRGHLHTCGPYFPTFIDACLACKPRSMDIAIMRGMGKTKSDMTEFLAQARANGVLLFGSLDMNDAHIFDEGAVKPDDEMFRAFIKGGWMPSGFGPAAEGGAFVERVKRLSV